MTVDTFFAPAERATHEDIMHDAEMLVEAGIMDHLTHVIPSILLILNRQRQVVYSNRRLLELLDVDSDRAILGLRPGEILDCVHAHNQCSGCGTSEFCSECGAVKAILKSQHEKAGVEAECRITTRSGNSLEFKIWASPFTRKNSEFTIISIMDIQDRKRREALEQTFFHDINNLVSSIAGYSDQINMAYDAEETEGLILDIQSAIKEMVSEITGHQKLLMAEQDKLMPVVSNHISSIALAQELRSLYPDKAICIDEKSDNFTLSSDRSLLFRVLLNMLKNANEASDANEPVTISCRKESDTGIFSIHNMAFMERPVQLQIFQRSFTTKGKGHGIGTYSMRLFGEKYLKGKVGFTTSKKNGTTFYIAVPLNYPEDY